MHYNKLNRHNIHSISSKVENGKIQRFTKLKILRKEIIDERPLTAASTITALIS